MQNDLENTKIIVSREKFELFRDAIRRAPWWDREAGELLRDMRQFLEQKDKKYINITYGEFKQLKSKLMLVIERHRLDSPWGAWTKNGHYVV